MFIDLFFVPSFIKQSIKLLFFYLKNTNFVPLLSSKHKLRPNYTLCTRNKITCYRPNYAIFNAIALSHTPGGTNFVMIVFKL